MTSQTSYCAQLLKQYQYPYYLLGLFIPNKKQREAFYAIFTLHHELSKIKTITSEDMTALIRLQWWEDVLKEITNGHVKEHPVIQALFNAQNQYNRLDLHTCISSIKTLKDFYEHKSVKDLNELSNLQQHYTKPFLDAACAILDIDECTNTLAACIGLTQTLLDAAQDIDHQHYLLPTDLTNKNSINIQDDSIESLSIKLKPSIEQIAEHAHKLLRTLDSPKSKQTFPIHGWYYIIQKQLQHIKRCDYNITYFTPKRIYSSLPLHLYCKYALRRRK